MQKTWRSHVLLAYSLAILAFLYVPLVILAMYSFNDSRINAVWFPHQCGVDRFHFPVVRAALQ